MDWCKFDTFCLDFFCTILPVAAINSLMLPLMPVLAKTGHLCFTSDVIAFVQIRDHVYSSSVEGTDPFNDTPKQSDWFNWAWDTYENCLEIKVKTPEKNFPLQPLATPWKGFPASLTLSLEFLNWTKPSEGQQLQQKDEKWKREKQKNKNNLNFHRGSRNTLSWFMLLKTR